MMRPRALPLLLWICATSALPTARADDAREACVVALSDPEVETYVARTRADLHRAERRARRWMFAWIAVNSVFVVGGAGYAVLFRDDPLQRDSGILGAAGSALTLGTMFAPPLSTAFATRRLARRAEREGDTPRNRLVHQLDALELGARQERALRAPVMHVLNATWGLAEGLYLGLRYDRSAFTAVFNGVGSFAVAETQMLTGPREAERALGRLRDEGAPCTQAPQASRRVHLHLAGLSLAGTF